MVMHARKPQRINDGYFEKHQAHPYQNSKYSKSTGGAVAAVGRGEYSERYMRDSPNGNSYRSDSPECDSPRDRDRDTRDRERERAYSKPYLHKIRDKERDNRDYKFSRDKYPPECVRSPKDKRRERLDSEHRTNHDRECSEKVSGVPKAHGGRKGTPNCPPDKRVEDRDRVVRVGDWSEHLSSSGKKYYYNCKTEVSQWEKPREWVDRERVDRDRDRDRDRALLQARNKDRERDERDRYTSRTSHEKHSNSRTRDGNSRVGKRLEGHWGGSSRDDEPLETRRKLDGDSAQDMDISPGDSTPTSEASYSHSGTPTASRQCGTPIVEPPVTNQGPVLLANALPRLISHPSTPTNTTRSYKPQLNKSPTSMIATSTPSMVPAPNNIVPSNAPGPPVTLASLPRLLSQITGNKQLEQTELNPQKALQSIQNALLMNRQTDGLTTPLKLDTGGSSSDPQGPPTPTHSESQDGVDRKVVVEAVVSSSNLSSLQSFTQTQGAGPLAALRPQGPNLTPSLANHCRQDLLAHVQGWPADLLEKQANKFTDESLTLGNIQCTRVSSDLKCARSIVRLTEIQATLQDQRIMYLRQQIQRLEDLKSQSSFLKMSEDL